MVDSPDTPPTSHQNEAASISKPPTPELNTSTTPPSRRPNASKVYGLRFFVILVALAVVTVLVAISLSQFHITEWSATSPREYADLVYLLSAVIAGGATLLLGGVVTVAPLLSLALHQSYDSIFEVTRRLIEKRIVTAADRSLATEHVRRLQSDLVVYEQLNPWYYAVWAFSVAVMAFIPVVFVISPWFDKNSYRVSMIFFFVSSILCVLFALISLTFFFRIRPGVTKLLLFVTLLEAMTTEKGLYIEPQQTDRDFSARWTFAGIIIATVLLAATAMSLWPEDEELTLAVNSVAVASGPVVLAKDLGFTDKFELKLGEKPFAAGRLALDALLGGQVDIATAAETPVLYASIKRPDLRIILTITESEFRIVARPEAGIKQISDLKGKKVATLLGTSADYFLDRMLVLHGLSRDDIVTHNLQPADMVSALRSGTVDAITVWEPHAWKAMDLVRNPVVFEDQNLYLERFNLVTTDAVLANPSKRAAITKLLTAVIATTEYMRIHEDESITLLAKRLGMHEHELKNIWDRFSFPAHLDKALLSSLRDVEGWAAQKDLRQVRPTNVLGTLVAPGVLHDINPDLVLLR